jgi:hypothetical protein
MSKLTWVKVGATWSEIIRDFTGQRPREAFVTYRVITEPGPDGGGEIEKQTKGKDDDDTSTYSPEDLVNEGTLLDKDPDQSEGVELNCEWFFMERTENVNVDTFSRGAYKFIRKVRGDCPRCGGGEGGCQDCSGSGECSTCGANGQCGNCSGSGECGDCSGEGKCYSCDGEGKCTNCEGKGRFDGDGGPCDSCHGTGKCENCGGSGKCPTCGGSRRCAECNGTGKCGDCHGSMRCTSCNGSLKCRDCGGVGKALTSDEYWYDMATGVVLRYTRSINGKVVMERKVTSLGISGAPSPVIARPTQVYMSPTESVNTYVSPQPPLPRPTLRVPDNCPNCGKSLRAVGTPVFCPFCNTRLLQ